MTAAALILLLGLPVNWQDPATGERYCGTLLHVDDLRLGGRATILPAISPHWLATVPIAIVSEGCPR